MGSTSDPPERLAAAAAVIRAEAAAVSQLEALLDETFLEAVDLMTACEGMVVVTGMGKAGLIGAKLSATLASTGTPSLSLHPAEALHGDLGRIRSQDIVLALSNSGESAEVLALIPSARRIGATLIAMTGAADSALARAADCVLDIGRADEACPLGLAPTASTSAMLALGDALAMVVHTERGFRREEFALYHPAGSLGRRLMRVSEVMRQGEELPLAAAGSPLQAVLATMSTTAGRPGAALVVDEEGLLLGIFTDGDWRRMAEGAAPEDLARYLSEPIDEHMGRRPRTAAPEQLVEEAVRILRENRVDQVPVVDGDGCPVGLLDVQDIIDVRV